MAIIIESTSSNAPGGSGTSITVNTPSGVQAGEVLVALIGCSFTSGTFNASATGWTLQRQRQHSNNQQGLAVLTRTVQVGEPTSHTFNLNVSGSSRRGIVLRLSGADPNTPMDATPSDDAGSGTVIAASSITTAHNNSLILMAANWSANATSFTPDQLTTTLVINRLGAAHGIQAAAGASGNKTATIANSTWISILLAVMESQSAANLPPGVSPVTADQAQLSAPPQLEFVGNDPDNDPITYQLTLADNIQLGNGLNVTESLTSGSGTPIHPNPSAVLTWEGYWQVDDRVGMGFQGKGGILDSVDFYFSAHETFPTLTDGYYLVRIYEAEGLPINPVPPNWQASTAYTQGQIVRPTSTANANVHFVYRCKVAGTSGSTEPIWPGNGVAWKSIPPGQEVTDGSITWEALPGLYPKNPADPANTPTPGWLAQSTVYAYAPGVLDEGWKTCEFTGVNRIRLQANKWYIAMLDWRPNDTNVNNTINITNASLANAVAPGNVYLDASSSNNNGPRIIEDSWFRVREVQVSNTYNSDVDSGFTNVDTPADTDPFNSGDKIRFTANLIATGEWFWRVRGKDPTGSGTFGDWTAVRQFEITATIHPQLSSSYSSQVCMTIAITQSQTLVMANSHHQQLAASIGITQTQQITSASANQQQITSITAIIQNQSVQLIDSAQIQSAGTIQIAAESELTIRSTVQNQVTASVPIGQIQNISLTSANQIFVAGIISIAQNHSISINDAWQSQTATRVIVNMSETGTMTMTGSSPNITTTTNQGSISLTTRQPDSNFDETNGSITWT